MAFDYLKVQLTTYPCLGIIDATKPFRIHVDACVVDGRGIGAVLLQMIPEDYAEWRRLKAKEKLMHDQIRANELDPATIQKDKSIPPSIDIILEDGTTLPTQPPKTFGKKVRVEHTGVKVDAIWEPRWRPVAYCLSLIHI